MIKLDLEYLLKEKNYKHFYCWITSNNIEVMAYGLEGLYRSALEGNKLSNQDLRIMDSLINDKKKFTEFSGCIPITINYSGIVTKKCMNWLKNKHFLNNEKRRLREAIKCRPFAW